MKNHNGKNRTIVEAPKIAYGNSIVPATFNTAAPQNRYKHSGMYSNIMALNIQHGIGI